MMTLLDELEPPRERWPNLRRPDWLTKDSAWVVLDRLKWGPACGQDFIHTTNTARYSARIMELRGWGFTIIGRPCTRHEHRTAKSEEYVLVGVPYGVVA